MTRARPRSLDIVHICALSAAILVSLGTTAPPPAAAREMWRSGDAYLDVSGSLRELALVSRGTSLQAFQAGLVPSCLVDFANCPAFDAVDQERIGLSLTRLRARIDGRASAHWSASIVFDNQLVLGNLDTLEAQLGDEISRRTLVDAAGSVGNDRVEYEYALYRGWVGFESRHFESVVGRQRVPWGVGRLWNPIDRFNAIRPLAFQADQSPGVDAVLARALFTGFTQLEAVFAPGRSSAEHAYAIRLQGVAYDVDYGLVSGVFDEAPMAGADVSFNLGGAAARAEVTYTHPETTYWPIGAPAPVPLGDFWQVVVSIDTLLDWGNGLYLLAEHLYNGNALGFGTGKAGPLLPLFEQTAVPPFYAITSPTRFGGSRVVTRSSQLTGLQLGYDLLPEWNLNVLVIYDWDGESAVFYPALRFTPRGWLDITLAVQGTAGPHLSEFGNVPTTAFLLADVHF